jgi:RNA polymerase primary sigma factor
MAYLTDRFAKQETGVKNKSVLASGNAKIAGTETGDIVENANYHIAKNLALEKTKFITALAQFPATALWLLTKYDQKFNDDESDDEETILSDQQNAISAIKKQFFLVSQEFTNSHVFAENYAVECQLLTESVQEFPFSFEDLTELADFIVYAFKARGCTPQNTSLSKSQSDFLVKRLEGLKLRSKAKLPGFIETFRSKEFDEQFLFLSSSEMCNLFNEIAFAERLWLENRQKLASANTRLVLFIANQYKGGFLDFDDLVQEGQTGLLKAVDRFNYQLGFQFSTYAGYWIRQAISRALTRCERVVRLPFGQMATINKVFRAKEELIARLGKEPNRVELAEHVGCSVEEINSILSISQTAMAFDADEDDEDPSGAPANFIEQGVFGHCFSDIAASELQVLISNAIATLNPREAKILCSHFGINQDHEMTLQEIGAELNLTRERVRQIQVMALNKIRLSYGEHLMSFL